MAPVLVSEVLLVSAGVPATVVIQDVNALKEHMRTSQVNCINYSRTVRTFHLLGKLCQHLYHVSCYGYNGNTTVSSE